MLGVNVYVLSGGEAVEILGRLTFVGKVDLLLNSN
jgi:hypothetical protein